MTLMRGIAQLLAAKSALSHVTGFLFALLFVWPHTLPFARADCYCYWNLVAFFMGVTECTHVTILCCR